MQNRRLSRPFSIMDPVAFLSGNLSNLKNSKLPDDFEERAKTPIHQGWLLKKGEVNTSWRSRYFVMYESAYIAYHKSDRSKPIGAIDLKDAYHAGPGVSSGQHSFEIHTATRIWTFDASSHENQSRWLKHLAKFVENQHIRESGTKYELKDFIDDLGDNENVISPSKSSFQRSFTNASFPGVETVRNLVRGSRPHLFHSDSTPAHQRVSVGRRGTKSKSPPPDSRKRKSNASDSRKKKSNASDSEKKKNTDINTEQILPKEPPRVRISTTLPTFRDRASSTLPPEPGAINDFIKDMDIHSSKSAPHASVLHDQHSSLKSSPPIQNDCKEAPEDPTHEARPLSDSVSQLFPPLEEEPDFSPNGSPESRNFWCFARPSLGDSVDGTNLRDNSSPTNSDYSMATWTGVNGPLVPETPDSEKHGTEYSSSSYSPSTTPSSKNSLSAQAANITRAQHERGRLNSVYKPGASGWMCGLCSTGNEDSTLQCVRCEAWKCPTCNMCNPVESRTCRVCRSRPKSQSDDFQADQSIVSKSQHQLKNILGFERRFVQSQQLTIGLFDEMKRKIAELTAVNNNLRSSLKKVETERDTIKTLYQKHILQQTRDLRRTTKTFEFFLVIGASPDFPKLADFKKGKAPDSWEEDPIVLYQYPENSDIHIDSIELINDFAASLTNFTFPDGCIVSKFSHEEPPTPPVHFTELSLSLGLGLGRHSRGEHCFAFALHEVGYGLCVIVKHVITVSDPYGESHKIVVPMCYLMLSRLPIFDIHVELIHRMLDIAGTTKQVLQSFYINNFVNDLFNDLYITLSSTISEPCLQEEKDDLLASWSCALAWSTMRKKTDEPDVDIFVSLLEMVLTECSIIVVGPTAMSSAGVFALSLLPSPMKWECALMPVLPASLSECMESPFPFLIGVSHIPDSVTIDPSRTGVWYPLRNKIVSPTYTGDGSSILKSKLGSQIKQPLKVLTQRLQHIYNPSVSHKKAVTNIRICVAEAVQDCIEMTLGRKAKGMFWKQLRDLQMRACHLNNMTDSKESLQSSDYGRLLASVDEKLIDEIFSFCGIDPLRYKKTYK